MQINGKDRRLKRASQATLLFSISYAYETHDWVVEKWASFKKNFQEIFVVSGFSALASKVVLRQFAKRLWLAPPLATVCADPPEVIRIDTDF